MGSRPKRQSVLSIAGNCAINNSIFRFVWLYIIGYTTDPHLKVREAKLSAIPRP